MLTQALFTVAANRRSRKGAWIEIPVAGSHSITGVVAPARERGLKCNFKISKPPVSVCRSRKGAWIEMVAKKWIVEILESLPQGSVD